MYHVIHNEVKYKTGRRGVQAKAIIRTLEGAVVLRLDDQPEKIVAEFVFDGAADKAAFIAAARKWNKEEAEFKIEETSANGVNDNYYVSEYARHLVAVAETKALAEHEAQKKAAPTPKPAAPVVMPAAAGTNKAEVARAIFKQMFAMSPVPARKDMIERAVKEAGLTPAGAATYLQKYKTDNGLVQKR